MSTRRVCLQESFHFMTAAGDERQLTRWLNNANRFNSVPIDVNVKALVGAHERKARLDGTHGRNIVVQIVKHKRLLMYMFLMAFLWVSEAHYKHLRYDQDLQIADTLTYYGLSFFSTSLAGNKYMNYVLLGLIECPANFASPYLLTWLGRRWFISGANLLAAVSFLLLIFVCEFTFL